MPYEQFSVASGPTTASGEAQPGFLDLNGTRFQNAGFLDVPAAVAGLENTGAASAWFPYDRMIQVPSFSSGADVPMGIYVWQRDQIVAQTGPANAWQSVHSVSGQQNVRDFGVKSGLKLVRGANGKPYVCGLAPGVTSAHVCWVKLDVNANVWTSGEVNVGARPTNMTFGISHNGTLVTTSAGNLYTFVPETDVVLVTPTSAGSDVRDKVFSLGNRLFLASIASGVLRVYEAYGAVKKHADVASGVFTNGDSDFGVLVTRSAAFIYYFDSAKKKHVWEVQAPGNDPFSALSFTDRTFAQWGDPFLQATDPSASPRFLCRNETETDPNNDGGGFIVIQGSVGSDSYPGTWGNYRFNGASSPPTFVNTQPGGHTYTSSQNGGGDSILHGAPAVDKVAVEVYDWTELENGQLQIRFGVFAATGAPVTTRLRLLYEVTQSGKSYQPTTEGTIISSTNGTVDGQRLANVSTYANGAPTSNYFTLVWDRQADGVDTSKPHAFKLECKDPF